MRRVGIYGRLDQPGLEPLVRGFEGHAHVSLRRLSVFTPDQVEPFDLVVSYGKRGAGKSLLEAYGPRCPTFVFDVASLIQPLHPTAWMIQPGDVNRLSPDVDASRLWMLPQPMNLSPRGSRILLCGPTRRDAGHPFDDEGLKVWFLLAASNLERQGYEVLWRPHPRDVWPLEGVPMSHPGIPIEEVMREPWAGLATFASTVGWTALMAGLPVFSAKESAYAAAAQTDFSKKARIPDRKIVNSLLRRLTWTVFLEEEMRSGLAPSFLLEQAETRRAA